MEVAASDDLSDQIKMSRQEKFILSTDSTLFLTIHDEFMKYDVLCT